MDISGKDVDTSKFSFDINDADNYAVEAILIKEKVGRTVKVVWDLRTASHDTGPGQGGDSAIRIDDRIIPLILKSRQGFSNRGERARI